MDNISPSHFQLAQWGQRRCHLKKLMKPTTQTLPPDGQQTTVYPISLPRAFGSGELKFFQEHDLYIKVKDWNVEVEWNKSLDHHSQIHLSF